MSAIVIILLCTFLTIILILMVASIYFFNVGIVRKPQNYTINSPDLAPGQFTGLAASDTAWLKEQPLEDLEMMSHDGLLLRGYYLTAMVPTNKTVVLAHGYIGSAKKDVVSFARMYHERFGYNVLMPDDRSHGESAGQYIGFGWLDRLDYLKWTHYALQRVGQDAQIVLHGISMGGTTVLMLSGEQLPEQVKCVISDCAYTSVKEILSYQLKRMYKLPAFPLMQCTSLVCKLRAGYFFGEASALQQVRKNTRPTLFIHGTDDTFVPVKMVHRLYEECNVYKEKLLVPDAGHGLAYTMDKAGYTQQVSDFLQQFVS